MTRCFVLVASLLSLAVSSTAHAQLKLPRVSPMATVSQSVGLTNVTITYSRPAVKGRQIWGGLVPHDKVWRTGANEATTFSISQDVTVDGQKLPAGTYSLHTIPGATGWTFIFNSVSDQWGSYSYDEKKDVLRIKAQPAVASDNVELLTFSFPEVTNTSARVELAWEKVRVGFTLETDTNAHAAKAIQEHMSRLEDWRSPWRAADYALNNNLPASDALKWVDRSIQVKENITNLGLKARILAKDGKTKDAIATAEKAVKVGRANKEDQGEIDALEKQLKEWKSAKK